jgi:hypothetical protein
MELTSRGIVRHGEWLFNGSRLRITAVSCFSSLRGLDVGRCEEWRSSNFFLNRLFCASLGWGEWGCEAVVALAGRSLKKKKRKRADYQIQQGGEPRVVQDLRPEALNAGVWIALTPCPMQADRIESVLYFFVVPGPRDIILS